MKVKYFIFLSISVIFSSNIFAQTNTLSIYFDYNKTAISENQQDSLTQFIKSLDGYKVETLVIKGYTDHKGYEDKNLILSQQRVNSVYSFLTKQGLNIASSTKKLGKGELPKSTNQSYDYRLDRRVDIACKKVKLQAKANSIKKDTANILGKEFVKKKDNTKGLEDINTAKVGETLILRDLNFVPGSAKLVSSAKIVRIALLEIMKENPNLKIEIQGHICCYPSSVTNDPLANERAKNIFFFLQSQGIEVSRITYTNFGASKKLFEHERTAQEQQANRRVEIKIIDK